MLPLGVKCVVKNRGLGTVEAICNNSNSGGFNFSYLVRLDNSQKLQWIDWNLIQQYDGPENQSNPKKLSKYEDVEY